MKKKISIFSALILITALIYSPLTADAKSSAYYAHAIRNVPVHATAGGRIIKVLPGNTPLNVYEESGNWAKIGFNGNNGYGYVYKSNIKAGGPVVRYKAYGSSALHTTEAGPVFDYVKNSKIINVYWESGKWAIVNYSGRSGYAYVYKPKLKHNDYPLLYEAYAKEKVYLHSSVGGPIVDQLPVKTPLRVIQDFGDWLVMPYNGYRGYAYVYKDNIQKGSTAPAYKGYARDDVALHSSAGGPITNWWPKDRLFEVYAENGNWLILGYPGRGGYAFAYKTRVGKLDRGVDLSHYQNDAGDIDFQSIGNQGISFAIVKATEGGDFVDPHFYNNIRDAKNAGIYTHAYHYFRSPENEENARKEANLFAGQFERAGVQGHAYIDVEVTNGANRDQITRSVNAFLDQMRLNGITKLGIYSYLNFYNNNLNLQNIKENNSGLRVWTARYRGSDTYKGPGLGFHTDVWQYTSEGKVNGIVGNVDMNYFYLN